MLPLPSAALYSCRMGEPTRPHRPIVVHPEEGVLGPATPGMERRQLFERGDDWAGWIRTDAGVAGDFINPANLVHREATSPEGEVEAFVVRVGEGPQVVNVDGPDAS
jgi:hypothetical protein